jgi:hypothetical protein
MRPRWLRPFLAVFLSSLLAPVAAGALTWGPTERFVHAHTSGNSEGDSGPPVDDFASTTDLGSFSQGARASNSGFEHGEPFVVTAQAQHSSTLGGDFATFALEASVYGFFSDPRGLAESVLSASFTLETPSRFSLAGDYELECCRNPRLENDLALLLDGPSGSIVEMRRSSTTASGSFEYGGLLAAGSYTLFASVGASIQNHPDDWPAEANLDGSFRLRPIPEPTALAMLAMGVAGLGARRH